VDVGVPPPSAVQPDQNVSDLQLIHLRRHNASSLLSVRGSEPIAALDVERHGVKITPVGVEVLQVHE
jgi:hypothetical protein